MNVVTARRVQEVHVELADGAAVVLEPDDRIYWAGRRVALQVVPDALADLAGWIEVESRAVYHDGDDPPEPWQVEDEMGQPARVRIFARGVVRVMTIYEGD